MAFADAGYLVIDKIVDIVGRVVLVMFVVLGLLAFISAIDSVHANSDSVADIEMREDVADGDYDKVWENSAVVAWLRIDGTNIDYPILQGADNSWYLNHDATGKYSVAGGIFLDYRNAADFSDGVSVIYGHRMNGDRMFSDIAKYADSEFLSEHRTVEFVFRGGEKKTMFVREYRVIPGDAKLYRQLVLPDDWGYDGQVVVLSTCDRRRRDMRDILILQE